MPKFNLTNQFVRKTPYSEKGQKFYWDSQLNRFGIRVSATTKSFICEKKCNGKSTRVTLGNFPDYSVADARKKATGVLAQLTNGIDVNQQKKDGQKETVTLEEAYIDYQKTRHNLAANTLKEYSAALRLGFPDWCNKEMRHITKDMVENRHLQLINERGGAQANKFNRTLRLLFNFAIAKYEIDNKPSITINPVSRISEIRAWSPTKRKTGHLKLSHLEPWFISVNNLDNHVVRNYLKLILFTGARRNEIATLRWTEVSIKNRYFKIIDTKNHVDMELPMSNQILQIILECKHNNPSLFVFPSPSSKSGHIEEARKVYTKVSNDIDHNFTIHDLRRTFITFAESLDISHYALKALINHKLSGPDVTAGYIQISVDRLRKPMQKISDFISLHAKSK